VIAADEGVGHGLRRPALPRAIYAIAGGQAGGHVQGFREQAHTVVDADHETWAGAREGSTMSIAIRNAVKLGMTDLEVSPIAFGAWQLGGEWGRVDEDEAVAAISHARGLGVNLFDTAQGYGFGASERVLGRALRDDLDHRRDEVVIATKGGLRMTGDGLVRDASPAWLRGGVDESRRALGVDHIDLYQVHWPDEQTPFEDTAGYLQELVDEGKIRHVGVSNFDQDQMAAFDRRRPVETLQPPYHLFRRHIEDGVLPYVREHDIGTLVYSPLGSGLLTGTMDSSTTFEESDWRSQASAFQGEKFRQNLEVVERLKSFAADKGVEVSQLAIAWVLAQGEDLVPIPGTKRRTYLEQNAGAVDVELTNEDMARIDAELPEAAGERYDEAGMAAVNL
jgi:aryl-alcohol dehydrogenase-like predicted oxidoreductase